MLPAEHKDGRAPLVEELESPVVDGGGVDLKEVLEDGEAGSGDTGQGGHFSLSMFQSSPCRKNFILHHSNHLLFVADRAFVLQSQLLTALELPSSFQIDLQKICRVEYPNTPARYALSSGLVMFWVRDALQLPLKTDATMPCAYNWQKLNQMCSHCPN